MILCLPRAADNLVKQPEIPFFYETLFCLQKLANRSYPKEVKPTFRTSLISVRFILTSSSDLDAVISCHEHSKHNSVSISSFPHSRQMPSHFAPSSSRSTLYVQSVNTDSTLYVCSKQLPVKNDNKV